MKEMRNAVGELLTIQGCIDGGCIVNTDLVRLNKKESIDFASAILEEAGERSLAEMVRDASRNVDMLDGGVK